MGYRHIDTASTYLNEPEVGRAIRASGIKREDITLCTKLPVEFVGKESEVLRFILKRLNTSYIDIWLLHAPVESSQLISTWNKMMECRSSGIVRQIGVSNFNLNQLDWMNKYLGEFPSVNQAYFNPWENLDNIVEQYHQRGMTPIAHSPLKAIKRSDVKSDISLKYHEVLKRYQRAGVPVLVRSKSTVHVIESLE